DLFVRDGDVHGRVRDLRVGDAAPYATFGETTDVRLADVEAVFIRKDPPFDDMYLFATLLLERVRGRTVIINDPRGLRDANEKLYALHFARWMPRTMVTSSEEQALGFLDGVGGKGVIKPLDLAGGSGVMLLTAGDKNARSIVQLLTG